MIEIMCFRLGDGADVEAFLAADKRLQTEFAYRQPGLLRRTTARADDGTWAVIDLWRSAEDADRCARAWNGDPLADAFRSFVDRDTVSVARYETLD